MNFNLKSEGTKSFLKKRNVSKDKNEKVKSSFNKIYNCWFFYKKKKQLFLSEIQFYCNEVWYHCDEYIDFITHIKWSDSKCVSMLSFINFSWW